MSGTENAILSGLTRPRKASYGGRLERLVAVSFVGASTGIAAAMAMYVFRVQEFAPGWATETLMATMVFAGGLLVKLLVGEMRASVTAMGVSVAVGTVLTFAFEIAPFYALGIGTANGYALYVPLRDVITFLVMFQIPLQFSGYLTGVVYDGFRS
ncbi:MAG: hypothetical protein ABEI99_04995 [Halobaculum sp.]